MQLFTVGCRRLACLAPLICSLFLEWNPLEAAVFSWEIAPQNSNWDNPLNWTGPANQFPDDNTDSASVLGINAIDPRLTDNRTLGALSVQGGGVMYTGDGTNNYSLIVQDIGGQSGTVTVDELATGNFTALYIEQSPSTFDLDTDYLVLRNGGIMYLRNNARAQVDQSFQTISSGSIGGHGLLEFGANSSNDGRLQAISGTLTVRRTGTATIDLDGAIGDGVLYASPNARLVIDSPLTDPTFNGTIVLLSNTELQINDPWVLEPSGGAQIDFNAPNGTASLSGMGVTLSGVVNIQAGTAILAAPTNVTNTATFTIREGSTVQFAAPTTFADPDNIENEFNTTFVVDEVVNIGQGAGTFNWDGLGQNGVVHGTTIVNPGGILRVQVQSLDEPGLDERVSADISMIGGDIYISNADGQWEMAGTLTMQNPDSVTVPVLAGFGIGGDEVLISGNVQVGGTGFSGLVMRSIFASTSNVQVAAGATLAIGGAQEGTNTVIAGGSWTGNGGVNLDADLATVAAATTVNMPLGTFDVDGDFSGDQLAINSPLTLNVNAVESNAGADTNEIDDPIQINSNGRLEVNLSVPSAVYRINTELDLNALGGGSASLHLTGSPVVLAGTTDVSGNSLSTARVEIAGTMIIAAGGTFNIRGGTDANPSVVRAGATVVGPGDLVVSASGPGYLRLDDAAGIGADLFNHGHLEVGSSPGHAAVASFTQSTSGTYEVKIDGLTPSLQYDQLLVDGFANVQGTLEVLVNENGGAYVDPAVAGTFDQFTLILAADLNGKFDVFSYDGTTLSISFSGAGQDRYHVGGGLFRILDYDPAQMDLLNYQALPGDANGDGSVDGSDFNLWNANKFTANNDWTKGDFNGDGFIDGSDFNLWNSFKFTGIDLGRPGDVHTEGSGFPAVPEPACATMLAAIFAVSLCRRTATSTEPTRSPSIPGWRLWVWNS